MRAWELRVRTAGGSYERAAARLEPAALAAAAQVAAEKAAVHAAQAACARGGALGVPSWRPSPTSRIMRRVKSSDIGLERSWSEELSAKQWLTKGVKRQCPGCGHRWLDKHRKDECPKCLCTLSLPLWRRHRRAPGEVSTFKERPGSAMASESGVCRYGGQHTWRFGRCAKCGKPEGTELEEAHAAAARTPRVVEGERARQRWVDLPAAYEVVESTVGGSARDVFR
jgi:hypothetical protein